MANLLMKMGELQEARLLLEEGLRKSRETLGDRHEVRLALINSMATLDRNIELQEVVHILFEEADLRL
eukprot:CAMPEP_0172297014 /NCGR_PEP_ID=MMETSP1058-20130122/193_1 /TAXON_ID=83371 /ORGANISM="Detonula confervacea, Strain CCMP 353" /LENGTH=67 /DNA_ID=CAMNT_0013006111 /DNA_START=30 /DNA_END=230 /DNA_ORIENTATION=+